MGPFPVAQVLRHQLALNVTRRLLQAGEQGLGLDQEELYDGGSTWDEPWMACKSGSVNNQVLPVHLMPTVFTNRAVRLHRTKTGWHLLTVTLCQVCAPWSTGIPSFNHPHDSMRGNVFIIPHLTVEEREAWKWKWKWLSYVQLFVTPWAVQSMEFSRSEYGSG